MFSDQTFCPVHVVRKSWRTCLVVAELTWMQEYACSFLPDSGTSWTLVFCISGIRNLIRHKNLFGMSCLDYGRICPNHFSCFWMVPPYRIRNLSTHKNSFSSPSQSRQYITKTCPCFPFLDYRRCNGAESMHATASIVRNILLSVFWNPEHQ